MRKGSRLARLFGVSVAEGTELYRPSAERIERSRMRAFQRFVEREHGLSFASYAELWRWSVTEVEAFWSALAAFFDVRFHSPPVRVLGGAMPVVRWFEGATLSYAEHALRG